MIRSGHLYRHFKGHIYMAYCLAFANDSMYRNQSLLTVMRARHSEDMKLVTLAFNQAYSKDLPILHFDPSECHFHSRNEHHVVYYSYEGEQFVDPREPVVGKRWWMRPLSSWDSEANVGMDKESVPRFVDLNKQVPIIHPDYARLTKR